MKIGTFAVLALTWNLYAGAAGLFAQSPAVKRFVINDL